MISQITKFINKNREGLSRYEIDLHLLKAGFDPEEIETAWNSFRQVNSSKRVFAHHQWQDLSQRYTKAMGIVMVIVMGAIILVCMFLFLIFTYAGNIGPY